jgi:hypothetical protein
MILGLDISTSIIGITILNKDGNIIHTEALDLRNKNHYPDVYKKYERVYAYFLELKLDYNYNFTHIFIEQSLQMFRSGFPLQRLYQHFPRSTGWFPTFATEN